VGCAVQNAWHLAPSDYSLLPRGERCSRKAAPLTQRCIAWCCVHRQLQKPWAEEIPWVLLGLQSQPREDTGLSPAEAVYGVPLFLPNEFLKVEEFSLDQIVNKFSKIVDTPAFSLPSKHNSGQQLPDELPVDLLCASLVQICCGTAESSRPCSGLTTAPTLCSFTIWFGNWEEIVSTSCLKPCTDDMPEPGLPGCWGRLPSAGEVAKLVTHHHSCPTTMKRVSFSDPLVSTPFQ
jgi:hypothetical protein